MPNIFSRGKQNPSFVLDVQVRNLQLEIKPSDRSEEWVSEMKLILFWAIRSIWKPRKALLGALLLLTSYYTY